MGREASFEMDCSGFSGSVTGLIRLLNSLGWGYYDEDNHAEYLPVGDRDDFDWQIGEITESGLYAILDRKLQRGETVGLVMYYRGTSHGITFLAADTSEIIIIPNINRKTPDDDEDSITDVNWYIEKIFQKLFWYNCGLVSFRFEENEDPENDRDDFDELTATDAEEDGEITEDTGSTDDFEDFDDLEDFQ